MTKQEWLDCYEISKLFDQVKNSRKRQLIALTCCKSVEYLSNQECKNFLEKIELFIDEKIDVKELEKHKKAAISHDVATLDNFIVALQKMYNSVDPTNISVFSYWSSYWVVFYSALAKDERINEQTKYVKDIYNPFLLDLKFSEQAISLAHQIYDGDNDARGILSDYLEDEGYPDEIVAHLKSGEHYKGCWLIDQILEKS